MKVDDLTIYLTMVDQTKKVMSKFEKRMGKINKLGKLVGGTLAGIGAAAVSGFGKAAEDGRQFFLELDTMRRLLNVTTQEADGLVQTIRQFAPGAEVQKLQEALLTLEEGFFDAHAASGPLNDLLKKFNVNIDLGAEGANAQLIEFLKGLRQIPSEADRVGAAIANLGADDAKPFIALARNVQDLDRAIEQLSGSINDIPNVVTQDQVDDVNAYTKSAKLLGAAWDNFARDTFASLAPFFTWINEMLIKIIGVMEKLREAIGSFINRTGALVDFVGGKLTGVINKVGGVLGLDPIGGGDDPVSRTMDSIADSLAGNNIGGAANDAGNDAVESAANAISTAKTTKAIDVKMTELEKAVEYAKAVREGINSANDARDIVFLQDLDKVNAGDSTDQAGFNLNFPEVQTEEEIRAERLAKEKKEYDNITESINNMGSALDSMAQSSTISSSKTFKAFQKLQVAISAAAAISAAVQTLADPTLGFFGKLAAYTKIVAIGAGAVAQLRAINVGSASVNTASAGGTANLNTGAQSADQAVQQQPTQQQGPTRNITVNIQGTTGFTADQVEDLIETINDTDTATKINSNRVAA